MTSEQKILVVEDNDFVRMQIVQFLKGEGFELIETADGQAALDKMTAQIALAIVDVRMEPIDGFEFVRTIRSMNMDTPVILVTGDQNPDLLSQANKLGIAAVLMKPVQKERLIKTVARTLQSKARAS